MPLEWLKKPEFDREAARQMFTELAGHFRETMGAGMSSVEFYTALAEKLSKAAGREKPWTWRYAQGVEKGNIQISHDFAHAVEILAAEVDGLPAQIGRLEAVEVFAEPGTVRRGAIVMGQSQVCAGLGCGRVFIPNHPRRKFCPICRPGRRGV
jgi:hypothetical protein